MAQYYQVNLDGLNLENCIIMSEDGTQISPRQVSDHAYTVNIQQLNREHCLIRLHFYFLYAL